MKAAAPSPLRLAGVWRPRRLGPLVFGAVALLACGQAHGAVPAYQRTAALSYDKIARSSPSPHARRVGFVSDVRPLTGSRTVLPVTGQAERHGRRWLRVRLPQRPDGSTGWISAGGVTLGEDPWHVIIDRAERAATIYHKGRVTRTFPVVVGKPSTPTPAGDFFLAEIVYEGYALQTGPYALASSAYSNVLQEFDGGPGQVALHGLVGLTGTPGQAVSHGCVRFYDQDITWLAKHLTPGTPITII
ncbi:MAG TPA: L,D-transpeptidase [Solirubrobacteraceae bacterium]